MILNLSESLAKPLVMAKLNMAYLSSLKNRAKLLLSSLPVVKFKKPSKTAVVLIAGVTISGTPWPRHFIVPPHCRCHHLGYSVPPALHRTIWCRSTFGPRGPGLSNPTSFLRPALPMAPTTDNNARDERSVLRPNPATFLRDFTLYMTTNYAIIWKRCLNYIAVITL